MIRLKPGTTIEYHADGSVSVKNVGTHVPDLYPAGSLEAADWRHLAGGDAALGPLKKGKKTVMRFVSHVNAATRDVELKERR